MFGKIIGTGKYVPSKKITNSMLAEVVETDDEWIKDRTGIESRHVMEYETTAYMATEAAKKAIEDADIDAEDIDMIIVSTVSSNVILPNTACAVQKEIGATNASCFDINTACTGFIMAYNTVQSFINTGLIETALIIGAEGLSKIVDWTDRGTCILFGDGAGAAIIRKDEKAVFKTVMHADGTKEKALTCDEAFTLRDTPFTPVNAKDEKQTYVNMDGKEVFAFAVKQVPMCIKELMSNMGIEEKDIDMFVLHQANKRIVQSVAKRIGASMDKVPMNMDKYGNTSSACIPILLDEIRKEGKLKEGDRVIMSGFGAGLTWAATYMEM